MSDRIVIRKPDDFHVHLRQGDMLQAVAHWTARVFARALVMPNTTPPILTSRDAERYQNEILNSTTEAGLSGFKPFTTIKLTRRTAPETITSACRSGVLAAKLYPAGVTTNSSDGISDIESVYGLFTTMERDGMVLCVHPESPGVFSMDREKHYLATLDKIRKEFPKLKIVVEHITTMEAAQWVKENDNCAATVTVHHLILTLDDVIGDKLNPHNFCKPIAKRPTDRDYILSCVIGGRHADKFFLGTDSAPHHIDTKHCAAGCAGIYSAPVALSILADLFEVEAGVGWTDALEAFTSIRGAKFYGLPLNEERITIKKKEWRVPDMIDGVVPLLAGCELGWIPEPIDTYLTEQRHDLLVKSDAE